MTHVLVMNAKLMRNEQLWQTLDIGNMFGSTFGFKLHNDFAQHNKAVHLITHALQAYIYTRFFPLTNLRNLDNKSPPNKQSQIGSLNVHAHT